MGALVLLLLAQVVFSLRWTLSHDEVPLLYEAFLMQGGALPYKDFFDFQMPGSYLIYYLLSLPSMFGPVRIRLLDIAILAFILTFAYATLKKTSKASAALAALLFGLMYLGGGPTLSLQREYLILIFLAPALFFSMQETLSPRKRFLLGILFGLAATVKPHAAIGLIPIAAFDLYPLWRLRRDWVKQASLYALGFVIPVLCVALWLAQNQALTPFLNIAVNYWSLYGQINGALDVLSAEQRLPYMLNLVWRLGGNGLWLIPAALAVYLNPNKKTYLLASLTLCYAVYPAFTGQFFSYHYILFLYFVAVLSALCLAETPSTKPRFKKYAPLVLFAVVLFSVKPSAIFLRQLKGEPVAFAPNRAAEISAFLKENRASQDRVQPLDWTGGTLLAMLENRAPLATSYVFDFYFYHHISTPYIQNLRADFMKQLQIARPRFIVEVTSLDKPWVGGEDTSRVKFAELQNFLDARYSVVLQKEDFRIYELKDAKR